MKNIPDSHDARFDRLVDGELNEMERRELLAGLDQETSGWRRCALAFLESQCWKDSLAGMAFGDSRRSEERESPKAVPAVRVRSHWLVHVRTGMAMAACFMVALLIGSLLPRGRLSPNDASPLAGGGQVAASKVDSPSAGVGAAVEQVAGQGPNTRRSPAAPGAWQTVTLAPSSGVGDMSSLRLPAEERQTVDDAWLRSVPPAIPREVLDALQRTGHQVQQRREVVPMPMQDGRQLLVPVDQVDVHYQGNGAY